MIDRDYGETTQGAEETGGEERLGDFEPPRVKVVGSVEDLTTQIKESPAADGSFGTSFTSAEANPGRGVIQITQSDPRRSGRSVGIAAPPTHALRALRREFEQHHCARLPGLLNGALLDRVQREIEAGEFFQRSDEFRTELCMKPGRALALLAFLANDPDLFQLVREISGCDRIGSFRGRLYRMLPRSDHHDSWHGDLIEGRMVAMNINLGTVPYSGGVLEIREHRSKRAVQRVANTRAGDAVIFRIDPSLEHRVTTVEGAVPKTAYVGFFCSGSGSESDQTEAILAGEIVRD
jgi:hypothetical protein